MTVQFCNADFLKEYLRMLGADTKCLNPPIYGKILFVISISDLILVFENAAV